MSHYDYAQPGAYFVTICTYERFHILGEIIDKNMVLNRNGKIVVSIWNQIPVFNPYVTIDYFAVLPNHVHGILIINDTENTLIENPVSLGRKKPLSEIVRAFKTFSAKQINELRNVRGVPVWQRNYYERVVRNDSEQNLIREYISTNPEQWQLDRENAEHTGISSLEKSIFL